MYTCSKKKTFDWLSIRRAAKAKDCGVDSLLGKDFVERLMSKIDEYDMVTHLSCDYHYQN